MKCLAIADLFINAAMMESGLKALRDKGIEVEIREWSHDSVEKLQEDNLRVEQEGAEAVALPEALLQGTDDIDILITQFAPVNTAVFDKLPKLKYVGVLRGGVENVNLQVANARGVEVMNTPGRNARSVAEFTVGMILAEMRNIARSHDALRDKYWRKDGRTIRRSRSLAEKSWGWLASVILPNWSRDFSAALARRLSFTISTLQAMNVMRKSILWTNWYNAPTLSRYMLA